MLPTALLVIEALLGALPTTLPVLFTQSSPSLLRYPVLTSALPLPPSLKLKASDTQSLVSVWAGHLEGRTEPCEPPSHSGGLEAEGTEKIPNS